MARHQRIYGRWWRHCDRGVVRGAAVFVTIVTKPRLPLFGSVCKAQMVLSVFGHEVAEALQRQRTEGGIACYAKYVDQRLIFEKLARCP